MIYTVYAIKSIKKNYIYVGMTNHLRRRFMQHNNGKNRSTKAYVPYKIIYSESHVTRDKARQREKYFKGGSGKEYLKTLL